MNSALNLPTRDLGATYAKLCDGGRSLGALVVALRDYLEGGSLTAVVEDVICGDDSDLRVLVVSTATRDAKVASLILPLHEWAEESAPSYVARDIAEAFVRGILEMVSRGTRSALKDAACVMRLLVKEEESRSVLARSVSAFGGEHGFSTLDSNQRATMDALVAYCTTGELTENLVLALKSRDAAPRVAASARLATMPDARPRLLALLEWAHETGAGEAKDLAEGILLACEESLMRGNGGGLAEMAVLLEDIAVDRRLRTAFAASAQGVYPVRLRLRRSADDGQREQVEISRSLAGQSQERFGSVAVDLAVAGPEIANVHPSQGGAQVVRLYPIDSDDEDYQANRRAAGPKVTTVVLSRTIGSRVLDFSFGWSDSDHRQGDLQEGAFFFTVSGATTSWLRSYRFRIRLHGRAEAYVLPEDPHRRSRDRMSHTWLLPHPFGKNSLAEIEAFEMTFAGSEGGRQ